MKSLNSWMLHVKEYIENLLLRVWFWNVTCEIWYVKSDVWIVPPSLSSLFQTFVLPQIFHSLSTCHHYKPLFHYTAKNIFQLFKQFCWFISYNNWFTVNPKLDTRISFVRPPPPPPPPSRSYYPPLDSETGWTGELWSKTHLLNWQN